MKIIVQEGNKILRKKAEEVYVPNIKSTKIKRVLREMSLALQSQGDGVAIAAPQIGYSLQIFIVSHKIFNKDFNKNKEKETPPQDLPLGKGEVDRDFIFINPKISKRSKDKEWLPEGCLSVRWLYGKVQRSKKATVTAYNENGIKFTRGASGLLAQIFQHETDHLNGVLFIDHAKDIKEELPK